MYRTAEHHQRLRTRHASRPAQQVDDALEIVDVPDTDPCERVGVAGRREHCLDLGDVVSDALDLLDEGGSGCVRR